MNVVLVSRDLMLRSTTEGAANKLGLTLQDASDANSARALTTENDCRGAVIDLRLPGLQIAELVSQLRLTNENLSIIACGPHVHEQSLATAREAGCDTVVTRGQFERDAEEILRRCMAELDF